MASIIAYLENYVESTVGLPSDLARFLNTIRVLDDRASEVEAALRGTTEALCALKPVGSRQGGADNPEYVELSTQFKRLENQLYQFGEEKVTLAHHALDLIKQHQGELDETLKQFEQEAQAVPAGDGDAFNPFEATYATGGSRGKGKGVQDWDSLEPLAAPKINNSSNRAQNNNTNNNNNHNSAVANNANNATTGGNPQQQQQQQQQQHHTNSGSQSAPTGHKKRVREDQRLAAAVLAQADDFGGMGGMAVGFGGGGGSSNPGSMQAGGDAPPMYPPLQFMNHERTAGLLDSAQQPQLPGRLLQAADIRPELQGRQAEMYWPDDNMWYLIEIHSVNVVNKTAIIVYRTGEVEELNLSEIASEGHMSLIEM